MADVAYHMLVRSMDAFTYRDAEIARSVVLEDDKADALFNELYAEIITYVIEDPNRIGKANLLEWAMHNLERAADRATNICEWVVFMVEGQYVKLDSEYNAPPVAAD
jgi:phosphate transport system protein